MQLTAEGVRTTGFKSRRGGYSEEAVDEMLDRVVEVLLVQRRSADSLSNRTPGGPDVGAADAM
jgi:DivIVA domain-containing protein